MDMQLTLEFEQEDDGRRLAEVPELPGAMAYGATALEAMARAKILALRILADLLENGAVIPTAVNLRVPERA